MLICCSDEFKIFGKGLYFPSLINDVGTGAFLSNPDRNNPALSVEVPLGHTSPQLTRALHTHSSCSLGQVALPLGISSAPRNISGPEERAASSGFAFAAQKEVGKWPRQSES